jgi:hypothetical protein
MIRKENKLQKSYLSVVVVLSFCEWSVFPTVTTGWKYLQYKSIFCRGRFAFLFCTFSVVIFKSTKAVFVGKIFLLSSTVAYRLLKRDASNTYSSNSLLMIFRQKVNTTKERKNERKKERKKRA